MLRSQQLLILGRAGSDSSLGPEKSKDPGLQNFGLLMPPRPCRVPEQSGLLTLPQESASTLQCTQSKHVHMHIYIHIHIYLKFQELVGVYKRSPYFETAPNWLRTSAYIYTYIYIYVYVYVRNLKNWLRAFFGTALNRLSLTMCLSGSLRSLQGALCLGFGLCVLTRAFTSTQIQGMQALCVIRVCHNFWSVNGNLTCRAGAASTMA